MDARGVHAHRFGQLDEVERRFGQVHADEAVELLRLAVQGQHAPFQDVVGPVVRDDEDRADPVFRRRPERLVGVHGRAVPRETDDGAIRRRYLGPQRHGQAVSDAAALSPENLGSRTAYRAPEAGPCGGERLIHPHGAIGRARA